MSQPTLSKSLRSSLSSGVRPLSYEEHYVCPVCAHGEMSALVLTEAFACNFCRHIFTANLKDQSVQVVDSVQPMVWYWTGERWRGAPQPDASLTAIVWGFALALACLPATLIGISSYLFPALDGGVSRFSLLWTGSTFLIHILIVFWLIAEHYQWPWYVAAKVHLRR